MKKKEEKKKGGNVGHDPMYLCFYDPYFLTLSGTSIFTSHPRRLLENARHGFYHGMMEDVLNDESENISLSQLLDLST
jgi:hypothetical protein